MYKPARLPESEMHAIGNNMVDMIHAKFQHTSVRKLKSIIKQDNYVF